MKIEEKITQEENKRMENNFKEREEIIVKQKEELVRKELDVDLQDSLYKVALLDLKFEEAKKYSIIKILEAEVDDKKFKLTEIQNVRDKNIVHLTF